MLRSGAKLDAKTAQGETVLDWVQPEVAELLKAAAAAALDRMPRARAEPEAQEATSAPVKKRQRNERETSGQAKATETAPEEEAAGSAPTAAGGAADGGKDAERKRQKIIITAVQEEAEECDT